MLDKIPLGCLITLFMNAQAGYIIANLCKE